MQENQESRQEKVFELKKKSHEALKGKISEWKEVTEKSLDEVRQDAKERMEKLPGNGSKSEGES